VRSEEIWSRKRMICLVSAWRSEHSISTEHFEVRMQFRVHCGHHNKFARPFDHVSMAKIETWIPYVRRHSVSGYQNPFSSSGPRTTTQSSPYVESPCFETPSPMIAQMFAPYRSAQSYRENRCRPCNLPPTQLIVTSPDCPHLFLHWLASLTSTGAHRQIKSAHGVLPLWI
jgi:hypothetical protein